ncbi:MAG: hypothetical protein AAFR68_11650 [Pseudomonadota bacterium]
MGSDETVPLRLLLKSQGDTSREEIADLTDGVQHLLYDSDDVSAVSRELQTPPVGAKSGAGIDIGVLLMEVLPDAIGSVVHTIASYFKRPGAVPVKVVLKNEQRSVEVEFDPSGLSPDDLVNLVKKLES